MPSDLTPMMRQYLKIKNENKEAILFFRLGDFYEMFFDDALEATRILHITLTSRGKVEGSKVPMCGVPYHAANNYIARLIRHGKKVAICDQVEEPGPGKKIVERRITRVITPGTVTADELLDESVNNFILSLNESGGLFGLAYADISTGEFRVTEIDGRENLLAELYKISPSECLVPESLSKKIEFTSLKDIQLGAVTVNDDWMYDHDLSLKEVKDHFRVDTLEGFGCQELELAVGAAGALIRYLKNTQKNSLANIDAISTYNSGQFMVMDRNTHRHLELTRNQEDLSSRGTLIEVLDRTRTPMGKRKIRAWMLSPLMEAREINGRLDAVEYFLLDPSARKRIRELLGDIYDIERLSNKISLGSANARDMVALASSAENVNRLREALSGDVPDAVKESLARMDDLSDVSGRIRECLVEEPPAPLREGGLIKPGYNAEVDELRSLVSGGKDWVARLQKKEIERTGISSLKVGYNKVFGYYIEVTKPNLDAVPDGYIRKQTLVNAERFITQELKDQEARIIGSQDRIKDLEYGIFCSLRDEVAARIERLKRTAEAVAVIDVFADLAEVAATNRYCRPRMNNDGVLRLVEARHPVLENILREKEFVSNDTFMDASDSRIFIITGSNMAGKSTYIRQVALVVIMAQMGGFVPAREAEIGVVDRIFTRVGASDRLYQGMSTFMVEMLETANILNNATARSLIILDEIGRGTSTFDGVSIAWAVVEFIHHSLEGAKALFATHYHELTELASLMSGIKNYHLAVREWGEEVVFLYKAKEGSCDDSFGIHVAKLAGMPGDVVKRAREILDNLQKESVTGSIRSRFLEKNRAREKQLDLFEASYREHPALEELKKLDTDNLTPLEALKKLNDLKKDLE